MKRKFKRGLFWVLAFAVASGLMLPSGVMAAEDMHTKEPVGQAAERITLEGSDSISENTIETLEENEGAILFADQDIERNAVSTQNVKLTYSRILRHENWFTRLFTVEYDGKTRIAYCVEPDEYPPEKGEHPVLQVDNALMEKALYYSYGYPGYDAVTKQYLDKCSKDDCYNGTDGAYVLSHIMLSYMYDNKSSESDAFRGIGSDTKKLIVEMAKLLEEEWPDVPDDASLELNATEFMAEWNKEKQYQETPVIKLNGHRDNKITVAVPEDTVMIKLSGDELSEHECGNVEVHGGDEFFFTAGPSKSGVYESGNLQGGLREFQAYMIQVSGKQDIMYCGDGAKDSVSFKIHWMDIGKFRLNKISAAPEITDGNEKYSLKDALYGIYDEKGNLVDEIITDEAGNAELMLPYGVYSLQEIKSPIGYMLDENAYDLIIDRGEVTFEHKEELKPEEPVPMDDSPQTGDELPKRVLIAMAAASIALMAVIVIFAGPAATRRRAG